MSEDRLPTKLWVDAHIHQLTKTGTPFYIHQTGNYGSGMVMVKINGLEGSCKLMQQQRDLEGELGWMVMFKGELVEESEADDYIQRAISRDPDLWVIEIEDKDMNNPFEGKVL